MTGDPRIVAWLRLSAALVMGAEAAGDRESALQSMHETLDSLPEFGTLPELGEQVEGVELATLAGDLLQDVHARLGRIIRESQRTPVASPMVDSTGPWRRERHGRT